MSRGFALDLALRQRWMRAALRGLTVASVAVLIATTETALVPAVASAQPEPVPPVAAASVDEAADIPSARANARLWGHKVEALSERTESSTTWVNPDGTQTTETNLAPVRVRVGDDTWVPVDLTLRANADGSVQSAAHPRGLTLAGAGTASGVRDLATVRGADGEVALQWSGPLPAPTLAGPTATYPEVRPGVDLVVTATRTGFEQLLVLKRKPTSPLVLTLPLRASGFRMNTDADGNTQVVKGDGTTVASVPVAQMWDARTDSRSGLPQKVVKVKQRKDAKPARTGAGGKAEAVTDITLEPADGFLDDPGVKYPVTIDPTVNMDTFTSFDTFVQSNIVNTDQSGSGELRLGTYDGGATKARSFLKFNVGHLAGARILSSTLWLRALHSATCSPRNFEVWDTYPGSVSTSTRWPGPAGWNKWATNGASYGYTGCAQQWVDTNIQNLAQGWSNGGVTEAAVLLKAENENDSTAWKKFHSAESGYVPHITTTYNRRPNVATGLNVSDREGQGAGVPVYTRSATPTLSFTPVDPDGDVLNAAMFVYENDTLVADKMFHNVPSGSVVQWKLPAGVLQNGKSYSFRATSNDSTDWADDAWVTIKSVGTNQVVDLPGCNPAATTQFVQNPANGSDCQRFALSNTGDGHHAIPVKATLQALDLRNCGTADGTAVQQHPYIGGNDCQKWRIEPAGTAEYKIIAKPSNKALDVPGCTQAAGNGLWTWTSFTTACQRWRLDMAPANGAQINWFAFTVDTQAPGAPYVASTDYPNDDAWHKGATQPGTFTFTPPGGSSDVTGYVYGLDATPATEIPAGTNGAATATITPATDGQHMLNVRTRDRARNLSPIVTHRFNVGRAGLIRPADGARVVNRLPLEVTGESAFTHVKFAWRRGPGAAIEADIPTANLRKADGTPLGTGFVPLTSLGGSATWNITDTLGATAGVVQVKAIMATDANGTGAYATVWRTVTADPDAEGAQSDDIGGGSVNLATGDFALSSTDAQEFGLSVSRTTSSRDPRSGYRPQRERLTANQQKVGTDTAGFTAMTADVTRSTTLGHESTDSITVTPKPSGTTGADSYAALGEDIGGLRLGMRAGRTYRISGWIYVPSATGLAPVDGRGLRIAGYYRSGGNYTFVGSAQPTVTDAWVQLSIDMTTPADTTEAFIRLYNGFTLGSGKAVHFDDLTVREMTAPFGPQWETGTSVDSAGIDYTRLEFLEDNVAQVELVDGGKVWFTRAQSGAFFPEPGAEDLTLTTEGDSYRLGELDGTSTLFTRAVAGGPYLVSSTTAPEDDSTTRYIYEQVDDIVRVKRAIAPLEPGIGDCTTPTPARGCEVLEYDYATTKTATPTAFGDITGQIRTIGVWTTDPATGTVSRVDVTRYAYDDGGRLREVWDPRLSTPLKTTYTYDTAGRVTEIGSPGDLPWKYDYGSVTGDTNAGRLLRVRRAALQQGSETALDGEIATTVVYKVPLTRAAGGPHDLDGPTVATWGQRDVATDATAVFGPEDPVATNSATGTTPGQNGYGAATVHYLDASGREVNTAVPGGHIDTAEYDRFGNSVRTLEASNRQLALGQGTGAAAKLADLGLAQYDTATRATYLDSQSVHSADGLDVISTKGPLARIALDANPGQLVNARATSSTTYDEGKPDGTAYHLPTTERTAAEVSGLTGEQDPKVTRTYYNTPIGGTSGWQIRQATRVVIDAEAPAGSLGAAETSIRYDAKARARESRKLDSTGTDTGTTLSVFYTAGANPDDATCGNKPEWAGQACLTKVAGPITGHDSARMPGDLSVKRVTAYTRFGEAAVITETAAGKTRTTTNTYDGADRLTSVQITGDLGTAVQAVSTTFDPATGDATDTAFADGTTIRRRFDKLGRLTRYTDADGAWTASEFDRFGKPVKVTDSVGSTQTFTYDRALDPRGLLTSMTDSVAGTSTATWGPNGQLLEQTLPGGVRLVNTLDPSGTPTARTYTRASDGTLIAASAVVANIRGQIVQSNGPASAKTFIYDRWGRLTTAVQFSTANASCTIRGYTYDRRSNRTGKTTKSSPTGCPGASDPATSETHTYDSADRVTDTGYTYDAFGRITTTPSGVSNSYYVNDLVAGQQTADQRMSWTIDPGLRFRGYTSEKLVNNAWANAVTKLNHYGDDSDSPRWTAEDITQPTNLTRNVEGPDGDLVATTGATGNVELTLTSLHGDVMATVPVNPTTNTITGAVTILDADEFGMPSADTPAAATARYGWLGGKQRSADTLGGVLLMGVRLYDPATGRFWQQDPTPGGNSTPYDYCSQDPVNCTDLDGNWGWLKSAFKAATRVVAKVAEVASYIPGPIGTIAAGVGSLAYAAQGNWKKAGEMALTAAANLVGAGAVVKVATKVVKVASKVAPKAAAAAPKAARSAATVCRKNSFTPDTLVLMADGTTRRIDNVNVGESVIAVDPDTSEVSAQPVLNVIIGYGTKHLIDVDLDPLNPDVITATAEHPFWVVGRGWIDAKHLRVGDLVREVDGTAVPVDSVDDLGLAWNTLVYNLSVGNVHTFQVVADGFDLTVHNTNANDPCGSGAGRSGKWAAVKALVNNDKMPKHMRGWIKNQVRQGKQKQAPGYEMAHYRTHEARRGCSYACSQPNLRILHKLQHKYDNNGKRTRGAAKIRR